MPVGGCAWVLRIHLTARKGGRATLRVQKKVPCQDVYSCRPCEPMILRLSLGLQVQKGISRVRGGVTPMKLAMLDMSWVRTGGVIASAYGPPCPHKSLRDLRPAIYPTKALKDFVRVPCHDHAQPLPRLSQYSDPSPATPKLIAAP